MLGKLQRNFYLECAKKNEIVYFFVFIHLKLNCTAAGAYTYISTGCQTRDRYLVVSLSVFLRIVCLVFGIITGWFEFHAVIFRNAVATVSVIVFSFVSFIFVDQERIRQLFAGVLFFKNFLIFFLLLQMAWMELPIERKKNFVKIKRAGKKTLGRYAINTYVRSCL